MSKARGAKLVRQFAEVVERQKEMLAPPQMAAKDKPAPPVEKAPGARSKPSGVVLSVHLPKRTLLLLRRLAGARQAAAGGGKASVSALLAEFVEDRRAEIEAEVERLEAEL